MQTADERRAYCRAWYAANKIRQQEKQKAARANNAVRTREYCRKWYAANKGAKSVEWKARARVSYERNRERMRVQYREKAARNRLAALSHYGPDGRPECHRCGIVDIDVLVLDHLANNGGKHRASDPNARKLAAWVVKNRFPPGFQTLCHNCNFKKRLEHLRSQR